MWRLIYSIPLWVAFIALRTALILLGWCLVTAAAAVSAYRKDPDGKYHFTWRLLWLWDNYEDGIANDTYWKAPTQLPVRLQEFLQIVYWSCIRNPVNNLRIVPGLSCQIDPAKVGFYGSFTQVTNPPAAIPDTFGVPDFWSAMTRHYDTKRPHWFFCWCGAYSCWYWQFTLNDSLRRVWIGWKIYPTDIFGVTQYRKLGAGFALQFKKVR